MAAGVGPGYLVDSGAGRDMGHGGSSTSDALTVTSNGDRRGDPDRDVGPLRRVLLDAAAEHGLSMKDLTVLDKRNDPYRIDTPAGHRDGAWLKAQIDELVDSWTIHLRGLHYILVTVQAVKPDGARYRNVEADWKWLLADAAKAARWLGYVPFSRIVDQRNDPPTVRTFDPMEPEPYLTFPLDITIPRVENIAPRLRVDDFEGVQPYRLVLAGEKSSLRPVLAPLADELSADLFLPNGHMSDTMAHQMAKAGSHDGRPMAVFYISDCDPSGWDMPGELARKMQALKTLLFPDLEVQVHRVALTPDQVREYNLPSTPLKDTETRADKWSLAMGVQQTEVDALAALRPDVLDRLVRDAVAPFYDSELDRRVAAAQRDWLDTARDVVTDHLDLEQRNRIRDDAGPKLDEMREQIEELNDQLRIDLDDFDLPDIVVPEAEVTGVGVTTPLFDSDDDFVDQTTWLIHDRSYGGSS